jgi:hypothetical protein
LNIFSVQKTWSPTEAALRLYNITSISPESPDSVECSDGEANTLKDIIQFQKISLIELNGG